MDTKIHLPEGFSHRPPGMADVPAAVALFNLCSQEMIGHDEFGIEDVANEWQTPNLNPQTDQVMVFAPTGELAAYAELWAFRENPVHPSLWGRVHPDYKSRGLGTALVTWGEWRSRQVLPQVPAHLRVSMWSRTVDSHQPSNDLLSGCGMTLIRHSFQMRIEMQAAPPEPVWPQGIRLRTFRPEDLQAVYQADDEAFQDHFGYTQEDPQAGLERFRHFLLKDEGFDPDLWFLALDGDEIAGLSLCRKHSWEDESMGWISSLAVRRPWRKRGLGLALLQHSFAAYWQRGLKRVGLGVDAENLTGALRLYQKAGMHVHRQYNLYEKELRPGTELATTAVEE